MTRKEADMCFLQAMLSLFLENIDDDVPSAINGYYEMMDTSRNINNLIGEVKQCMSPSIYVSFKQGYEKAIGTYGIKEGNKRMKKYLTEVISKNTGETEEDLIRRINRTNVSATIDAILDMKTADLQFLLLMLCVFRHPEDNPEMIEGFVATTLSEVKCGKMRHIGDIMSDKLFTSFSIGYKQAIEKYGLEEANKRMSDKILSVIVKNTGHDENEINSIIEKLYNKANDIFDIMSNGIHLTKDENGNYTLDE